MARRMDIELTSQRDDDTWTWRAAGARQPKGTLDASLLPPATKVGDVVRAEVEGFLDGMNVVAVLPPKTPRREPERLELLSPRSEGRLVTTSGARAGRGRTERPRRGERTGRGERERDHGRRRPERERTRGGRERSGDREVARAGGPEGPAPEAKPKPKRLRPGKAHRNALLESLPAEQRPIAEQLLQGGIPAVRQAIEKQNETLKSEGKPQVNPEPLLEIAERLRHRSQAASWRDRADAALAHVDELDLRDLRSVVNAAEDAGRDEEARTLANQLREALGNRVEKEQAAWVSEVADNLREGRVVRALRLTSRPPKAGSPVPADLAEQLVVATGEALTAETGPQRWATVLDALAYSPIRRRVVPSSLPEKLAPDLRETIARLATRLPEIAHIFDITPAPAPSRPNRPARRRSGKKSGGGGGGAGGSDGGAGGRGGRGGSATNGHRADRGTGETPEAEPAATEAPTEGPDSDVPASRDAAPVREEASSEAPPAESAAGSPSGDSPGSESPAAAPQEAPEAAAAEAAADAPAPEATGSEAPEAADPGTGQGEADARDEARQGEDAEAGEVQSAGSEPSDDQVTAGG